ncbi:MAG: tRNA 2-thiouridine(34) synthase MnmA [Candidatus Omnitrophica bacterium]|nr:tRNA 2-thiouridine(34) synthase MnmA [Candidatus Omnitrophota bacterium]
MKKRIAVGLSGGVDSSLAAYLLKKKGWDVIGFTLKFYPEENRCCDLDSLDQARRLCHKLDIPHYVLDAGELFQKEIIDYFVDSYLQGLTPNPCTYCNRLIKFGSFLEKVKSLDINYLATGHYARLIKKGKTYLLRSGKDSKKSQEYFLALLKPSILKHLVFPLGNYTKSEVKRIAKDKKIIHIERGESQDVCFVEEKSYSEFIEKKCSDYYQYSGQIKHVNGEILGRHKGIYHYTYGQRSGLGLAWKEPLYVVGIYSKDNSVIVGERKYLKNDFFTVNSLNWFYPSKQYKAITVKVRYNSSAFACVLKIDGNSASVKLDKEIDAIAPGQLAAFYYKDLLLGGGIIDKFKV